MKRILVIGVIVAAASSFALGQTTGTKPDQSKPIGEKVATPASAEQAVRQLFDELVSAYAKNDAAAPARIFADDFTFTNPFGEVMTKEQRLKSNPVALCSTLTVLTT